MSINEISQKYEKLTMAYIIFFLIMFIVPIIFVITSIFIPFEPDLIWILSCFYPAVFIFLFTMFCPDNCFEIPESGKAEFRAVELWTTLISTLCNVSFCILFSFYVYYLNDKYTHRTTLEKDYEKSVEINERSFR